MNATSPRIIIPAAPPTDAMRLRADRLFPKLHRSRLLGQDNLSAKRCEWATVVYPAVLQAHEAGGVARLPRGNRGVNNRIRRAVLDAAVDCEVLDTAPLGSARIHGGYVPGKRWK